MVLKSTNRCCGLKNILWQVLVGVCVVAALSCSVDDGRVLVDSPQLAFQTDLDDGDIEDGLGVDESTSSSSLAVSSTTVPVNDEPGGESTSSSSVPVSSTTLPRTDEPGDDGEPTDDDESGALGETDAPSASGGAKALEPWVEDRGGGLLLFDEPDVWEKLSLEVFDWCDDNAATIAVFGRPLGPGEDPLVAFKDYFDDYGWPVEFRDYHFELDRTRWSVGADCSKLGGKRYSALVTDNSPRRAFATRAEAVEYRNERLNTEHRRRFPSGRLLGWWGDLQREFPLEPRDEVVVLDSTVTASGGVIRGLVHNLSREHFARDVTVTARPVKTDADDNSEDEDQVLSWQWPLTLQPGERAPFEFNGWQHGNDVTKIDIRVTATLSPEVDISRSFAFAGYSYGDHPKHYPIEWWLYDFDVLVPTSHPSLADDVLTQTINDLRVYVAFFDDRDGKVVHLERVTTYSWASYGGNYGKESRETVEVEITSLPATRKDFPEPIASRDDLVIAGYDPALRAHFSFPHRSDYHQVWVGGANPQPES